MPGKRKPTVVIRLTEEELRILADVFGMGYESGHPDNVVEDRISRKLLDAHLRIIHRKE